MWSSVELRDLRVFITLAQELHFGHTAERLGITHSRVSQTIRTLETRLGGRLFERTSRRVQITRLGEELRDRVVPIYAALERALAETSDMAAGGLAGALRVGFTVTTDGPALSRVTEEFTTRHPDCELAFHEVDVWDPYSPLRRGTVDVLVNWLAVEEPDLTVGPAIALHDRVVAVASGHSLASRASVLLEDLADEEVSQPPPAFPDALKDAILPPRTPSGRPVRRIQVSRSTQEIIANVVHGRIVYPTMAGVSVFQRDDLVFVPIEDLPPLPLGLIWSSDRENGTIRALAEVARSLGPLAIESPPRQPG
jgi:DNA-binding transcriptional LysR family regulator